MNSIFPFLIVSILVTLSATIPVGCDWNKEKINQNEYLIQKSSFDSAHITTTEVISHPDKRIYVRGMGGIDEELRISEEKLKEFVENLRSHVDNNVFDYRRFEENTGILANEITKMQNRFGTSNIFLPQLKFVSHVFNVIKGSIEDLKHYKASDSPGSFLLYKVIELNIRAMVLYNSHGSLDLSVENYKKKVLQLNNSLLFWGIRFRSMFDVPHSLQVVFEKYTSIVQETLDSLESSIPKPLPPV